MTTVRNSIQLVGNIGKELELIEFDSGSSKVSFTMATNEYYKNSDGEKVQETQWHNVVAWGKLADLMNTYLKKGSEILLRGKLVHRSYNDKSGNTKYVSEIVADEFLMLGKKQDQKSPKLEDAF